MSHDCSIKLLASDARLVEIQKLMTGGFDASDIDYLVLNFTPQDLRREIMNAQIQIAVCRAFGEDEGERYWLEFERAARSALETRVWLESSSKPKTYPGQRLDPQAIKDRADIVSLIERYTRLRRSGRNFLGCCPCHDDRHPSFTVYPEQQSWHCFGCGQGGDVIAFIMLVEHLDFKGALIFLEKQHYGTG